MNHAVNLFFLAATIYMEAANQPYAGKLAVGWTIMNRAHQARKPVARVVLEPWQFSCWNTDAPTRRMLAALFDDVDDGDRVNQSWTECQRVAASVFYGIEADPTKGATHYLNPKVLTKLPSWYSSDKVTATVGDHEFLRFA